MSQTNSDDATHYVKRSGYTAKPFFVTELARVREFFDRATTRNLASSAALTFY